MQMHMLKLEFVSSSLGAARGCCGAQELIFGYVVVQRNCHMRFLPANVCPFWRLTTCFEFQRSQRGLSVQREGTN